VTSQESADCPSADQLTQFVRRELAPQKAQLLVEHIARCPRCVNSVQAIKKATPSPLDVRAMMDGGESLFGVAGRDASRQEDEWQAGRQASLWNDDSAGKEVAPGFVGAHDTAPAPQEYFRPTPAGDRPAALPIPSQPASVSKSFGDYEILCKLGEGGMGEVYKAKHRRMDRIVAMKVLPSEALNSPSAVERFHREVKASAKLVHPNIVAAYDAGEQNGIHYLVMEYVEGDDLSDVVEKQGPLPLPKAIDYVLQAARGLGHAHKKGVIHRDVKPANLILDMDGTIKVLDMGLAISPGGGISGEGSQRATRSGIIMGTPAYMAPEQAADIKRTDARADIYSLGCVLYFLVTGRDPYLGDSFIATLLAHREEPIPKLLGKVPGASPAIDGVFARMMAKRPEDRYQSMSELSTALEAALIHVADAGSELPEPPSSESLLDDTTPLLGLSLLGPVDPKQASAPARQETQRAETQRREAPGYDAPAKLPAKVGVTMEFLESMISTGIVNGDELAEVLSNFPDRPTRDELLNELVRREWLSNYQAGLIVKQGVASLQMGQYLLWEKVAQNDRAAKFIALHRDTRALASLKVFDTETAPLESLQHAAQLSHPHIAAVLEMGSAGAKTYIAGRYFHEADYVSLIRKDGKLPPERVLEVVLAAARGLAAAASEGLAHGNVGPWNLLRDEETGQIQITDFGWAGRYSYQADSSASEVRASNATRIPMPGDLAAPEVLTGAQPDPRSDMYSLGATLFYLASSLPPRWDKNLSDPRDAPPQLSDYAEARVPEGLQPVFEKMVCKRRKARFATWEDAIAALADPLAFVEASRPVAPPEPAPPEPPPPFMKRRTVALLLAGSIALFLIFLASFRLADEADVTTFEDDEGVEMIDRGEFARAIRYYDEQIAKKPKKASLYFHRGRAFDGELRTERALADLNMAITLAPENAEGYARRGDTYRREQDYKRALEDYTTTLQINPRFKGGKTRRGELYGLMGEHPQAIADLNDALAIDDKDINAYQARAKAYAAMGQHEKAKADRAKAQLLRDESVKDSS